MIHHRQGLSLGLEPGHHLLGVHPQLDDLERHAPPHRLGLLRHIHHPAPALADSLQQLVTPERLAYGFVRGVGILDPGAGWDGFGLRGKDGGGLLMRGGKQGLLALVARQGWLWI